MSKDQTITVVRAILLGLVCLGCESETPIGKTSGTDADNQTESESSDSDSNPWSLDTRSGLGDSSDDTAGSSGEDTESESTSGVDTTGDSGADTGVATDTDTVETGTVDPDTGECVDKETRCREGHLETCTLNAWTVSQSCPYACDHESGCYGECIPSTAECADVNSQKTCSDAYTWGSPVFCPYGCDVGGAGECKGGLPLVPFDANEEDLGKPQSWSARYGKTPEIIAASSGAELDVLAQDYDDATPHTAVLLHIAPTAQGYEVTAVDTDLPMLDRVMGLGVDDAGNRYYATGVDEAASVDSEYPPLDTWRSDIVRVVKIDPAGEVVFDIDLDVARHDFNAGAEPIINPMTYATARLAVGGGEIALLHGINTDPDWTIGGVRHQKALSTRLDAATGAVTRVSSIWVSHSFDQRLFYDGSGIIELHLGDAYPRQIAMGKSHKSYPLFDIKGPAGDNETYTRLGDMAVIENDPTYGYLAVFSTESTAAVGETISGPRNLAIVRVSAADSSLDPSLPDTLKVNSAGKDRTNVLRWLTNHTGDSGLHVERPKLVGVGDDRFIALWEEWTTSGFNGVYAMVIDGRGDELVPSTLITADHHLQRGDDAFYLDGEAGWITGTASTGKLHLHLVDGALDYRIFSF